MGLPEDMDCKFRFILVAAKRARQLQAGAKPLIQTQSKKMTTVALQEVAAGLVPYEIIEAPTTQNDARKKQKAGK